MATLTVYPDPTRTVSFDGSVGEQTSAAWATIRGLSSGDYAEYSTDYHIKYYTAAASNNWSEFKRAFVLFDTSALTSAASISAAVISFKGDGNASLDQLGTASVSIVSSTPASDTSISVGDYDQVGTTEFATARIGFGVWSTSAYNDFTLNASGIANISKTGVSKFGVRSNWDTDDAEPTWVASKFNTVSWYPSSRAGTSEDPKLVITYSTGLAGVKTVDDLAIASVKTINGLAIASVKTVNGLA